MTPVYVVNLPLSGLLRKEDSRYVTANNTTSNKALFFRYLILVKVNPDSFVLGGVAGAAFATVMCHVISMFISLIALSKNIKIKFDLSKYFIKPILASSSMGIIRNIYI